MELHGKEWDEEKIKRDLNQLDGKLGKRTERNHSSCC